MKATGIVRRVEEYGIIGQKPENRVNTMDFAVFVDTLQSPSQKSKISASPLCTRGPWVPATSVKEKDI